MELPPYKKKNEIHFAPPKKPWNDSIPQRKYQQPMVSTMVSRWCDMDSVHPQGSQKTNLTHESQSARPSGSASPSPHSRFTSTTEALSSCSRAPSLGKPSCDCLRVSDLKTHAANVSCEWWRLFPKPFTSFRSGTFLSLSASAGLPRATCFWKLRKAASARELTCLEIVWKEQINHGPFASFRGKKYSANLPQLQCGATFLAYMSTSISACAGNKNRHSTWEHACLVMFKHQHASHTSNRAMPMNRSTEWEILRLGSATMAPIRDALSHASHRQDMQIAP